MVVMAGVRGERKIHMVNHDTAAASLRERVTLSMSGDGVEVDIESYGS